MDQRMKLSGVMFRQVFSSLEELEETLSSGKELPIKSWITHDFVNEYRRIDAYRHNVGLCAKLYVAKNWQTVKDWSGLSVEIIDRHKEKNRTTIYYNWDIEYADKKHLLEEKEEPEIKEEETDPTKPRRGGRYRKHSFDSILRDIMLRDKEKHNPVVSVTKVFLDHDEDFNIQINGNDHIWINDEAVIIIADYIESKQPLPF